MRFGTIGGDGWPVPSRPHYIIQGVPVSNARNRDAEREISSLLSRFIATIHKLTPPQASVVLDVDEHMRADTLSRKDLTLLRDVAQAVEGQ